MPLSIDHYLKEDGTTRLWQRLTLVVLADKGEVFPDDPGNGTPKMVYLCNGNRKILFGSTLNCALGESELEGEQDMTYQLRPSQIDWLRKIEDEVDDFLFG